jgi:hypothetical protein
MMQFLFAIAALLLSPFFLCLYALYVALYCTVAGRDAWMRSDAASGERHRPRFNGGSER